MLDTQPKLNETYLIYLECVINLGEWSSLEANKTNIRVLAEYQLQKNIINTNIPPIISDYFLDELALKAWIFNKYSIQDYLQALEFMNSNKIVEEDQLQEIPKPKKTNKNFNQDIINIGYIIDKIDDYFTLLYLLLLRSKDKNIKTYIIVYQSTEFICNFKENYFIIIFNKMQHPIHNYELLKKYDLDIIFFFENLCTEIYDNLTIRKINQLLAYKPAPLIISYPYNGITRSEKIFDYLLLDKHIYTDENRVLYQEKLIICQTKDFSIKAEDFWISLKKKDFTNLYKLNNMSEEELKFEIEKFNFPDDVFFGNLSEPYKITETCFLSWLNILKLTDKTKLILKYSNDVQVQNFKINAEKNGVSEERIIFVNCNTREDYLDILKTIDIYLDIYFINGEDKLIIALFLNISCVCFSQIGDSENVLSNFSLKHIENNKLDIYATNYDEYQKIAIDYFRELTINILNVGYTRLKKIELIKNIKVTFKIFLKKIKFFLNFKEYFKYMQNSENEQTEPCGDFPIRHLYEFHYLNNGTQDIFI